MATSMRLARFLSRNFSSGSRSFPKMTHTYLPKMSMGNISRKSPFWDGAIRAGVEHFTIYNKMLYPWIFKNQHPDLEYWKVRENVVLVDVAVQRQVEVVGPDAHALVQYVTCRDLQQMPLNCGRYALMTDADGMVINDPVIYRVEPDRFWFSIADSDVQFYLRSVADLKKFDVKVFEAPVSPLGVFGPRSLSLTQEIVGSWVKDLKFFEIKETEVQGIPVCVSRSGFTPEHCYEILLLDESRGNDLWEIFWQAGQKHGIIAGCPNQQRRLEGGMVSWTADCWPRMTNALEMGLPKKMVAVDKSTPFVGQEALQKIQEEGIKRKFVGILVDGDRLGLSDDTSFFNYWTVSDGKRNIGHVTSLNWSPILQSNIGLAVVDIDYTKPGTTFDVLSEGLPNQIRRSATTSKIPFPGTKSQAPVPFEG